MYVDMCSKAYASSPRFKIWILSSRINVIKTNIDARIFHVDSLNFAVPPQKEKDQEDTGQLSSAKPMWNLHNSAFFFGGSWSKTCVQAWRRESTFMRRMLVEPLVSGLTLPEFSQHAVASWPYVIASRSDIFNFGYAQYPAVYDDIKFRPFKRLDVAASRLCHKSLATGLPAMHPVMSLPLPFLPK